MIHLPVRQVPVSIHVNIEATILTTGALAVTACTFGKLHGEPAVSHLITLAVSHMYSKVRFT
ncbi:hypothetical protein BJX96DRAFT_88142 [Aspergillus floccosus]